MSRTFTITILHYYGTVTIPIDIPITIAIPATGSTFVTLPRRYSGIPGVTRAHSALLGHARAYPALPRRLSVVALSRHSLLLLLLLLLSHYPYHRCSCYDYC